MVDTEFFDELDFTPGQSRDNALQADDVANAVKTILDMPAGSVIDQINLSPQNPWSEIRAGNHDNVVSGDVHIALAKII